MTSVAYDEMTDDFYARCDCGWEGQPYMRRRDAQMEADQHHDWHEEQVPA